MFGFLFSGAPLKKACRVIAERIVQRTSQTKTIFVMLGQIPADSTHNTDLRTERL